MPLVRRRAIPLADLRVGVHLIGAIDGANTSFAAPEAFLQVPPGAAIAVFVNGVRQDLAEDYTVAAAGPGLGGGVVLAEPPRTGDKITADYLAG